jgi:hypothetical protein
LCHLFWTLKAPPVMGRLPRVWVANSESLSRTDPAAAG